MSLFRRECLEAKKDNLMGEVIIYHSRVYSWITLLILFLIVSLIVFIVNGQYARKEIVRGEVKPAAGIIDVKSNASGGVIKSVH